jgi:hypothetical protein
MAVSAGTRIALLCGALVIAVRADAQTVIGLPGLDSSGEVESVSGLSVRLRQSSGFQAWTVSRAAMELKAVAVSGVMATIRPTRSIIDRLRTSGASLSSKPLRPVFTAGKAGALFKERRTSLPGYARYSKNVAYLPAGGVGLEYRVAAQVGLRGDVTLLVDPDRHFAPRYGVSVVVSLRSR